jgi:hypothetical protein
MVDPEGNPVRSGPKSVPEPMQPRAICAVASSRDRVDWQCDRPSQANQLADNRFHHFTGLISSTVGNEDSDNSQPVYPIRGTADSYHCQPPGAAVAVFPPRARIVRLPRRFPLLVFVTKQLSVTGAVQCRAPVDPLKESSQTCLLRSEGRTIYKNHRLCGLVACWTTIAERGNDLTHIFGTYEYVILNSRHLKRTLSCYFPPLSPSASEGQELT